MPDWINPYMPGNPESSLVPDSSRINDVKVTSKQGNTYDISSVTKTLDGVESRDGDLRRVKDVPVNLTVKANDAINLVIPFVLNTTAKESNTKINDNNDFYVLENGQQTGHLNVRSSTYAPLYPEDKIYPRVMVGNHTYTDEYPDNPGTLPLDPSVFSDEDFLNGYPDGIYKASTPTNKSTVYGSYTFSYLSLNKYEDYLTKHGFTVRFSSGKPMPYYGYTLSVSGAKVVDRNGNPVQDETKGHPYKGRRYFEVVPVILLNQDETYTTKTAPTAWDPSTMVNKVADPTNYRYWDQKTDSAVRMHNTVAQLTAKDFTVTITKDGQAVNPDANGKYDLSKPGTYTVTYSKDFNGTIISNYGHINVKSNADQYIPAYKDTTVAANSSVNTGSPSFTKDSEAVTDVPGHTYAFNDGTTKMTINDKNGKTPVTVTIDKTSGAITFTAPDDATEYDIPVTVTYEDGSSNTATAKVVVYKSLDPTKVDPTNPEYKDMFKTVTRDIVTTSVSGQQTTEAQSLDFGRTMTIYGNGDHATYGKWEALSADQFASKDITPVDGYTSYYKIGNDGQKVYASAVPSASALDKDGNPVAGTTVYVGYDKSNTPTPTENTTVTYTFYDDTDKKLVKGHDVTVTGQPGTDQKVNLTTPEGYKLAEGQTLPTSVTMLKANETITIHLIHATKDIKPNDPGVNPSDPVYADMFKTVTRTIKVNNPDRMVDTTTQQVNFNRTKTIDEVTDKVISYGNWTLATGSAKDWGQFNVPQLDGFISYVDGNAAKEVAEENVTADTADVTVEVTYKNSGNNGNNTTPGDDGNHNTNPGDNGSHNTNPGDNGSHNTNPGDNGSHNTNPGDNGSHNTNPGDNGSHNTNPGDNGSHNTNPGDNGSHNTNPGDNGSHNTNPGDNGSHNTNPGDNGNHNTNGNNNGINNGTQNGNGNKTVNTNVTDNSNGDNGQNNKQALPQTGNTKNDAAVAGLGLAGLLAMLGLGGLKKKRN
ncbi:hypothetical protein DN444_05920 [Lactobacillus reuteri]|nr:hypothetical protein [Limosilactobacillus reuteri]